MTTLTYGELDERSLKMTRSGPCWVTSYDELLGEPACDPTWWPATYAELLTGPGVTAEWPCWIASYNELVVGPFCVSPIPPPEPTEFPLPADPTCPTAWARPVWGGAWHEPGPQGWELLVESPLMHHCELRWGHGNDHWCGCQRGHVKPGEEGIVTPTYETIDPVHGILPDTQLPWPTQPDPMTGV